MLRQKSGSIVNVSTTLVDQPIAHSPSPELSLDVVMEQVFAGNHEVRRL